MAKAKTKQLSAEETVTKKRADDKRTIKKNYMTVIDLYEKQYDKWVKRGEKTEKRYRDERPEKAATEAASTGKSRYNILWSNIQTILPNIFARLPKPEVSRRFKDQDPIGRVAALLLERALEFEIENTDDYRDAVRNAVEDRLLPGRGVAFVRFDPHFKKAPSPAVAVKDDSQASDSNQYSLPSAKQEVGEGLVPRETQITEDAQPNEEVDIIDYEQCPVDYVGWRDFGHNVARTWEEVHKIWRKVPLDRQELIERFGEDLGKAIPLNTKGTGGEENKLSSPDDETGQKAVIYEVWDKKKRKIAWLCREYEYCLDYQDEPLKLDGFWPCPKPLYATITTNSLVPIPDFTMYQDQVEELDVLSQRISGLAEAIKVAGVYDAGQPEIKRLFKEGVNATLVPVDNWLIFAEKGGIRGSIEWFPLDQVVQALNAAYIARDQAKQVVYEIMGIADILRGASDPNETLGAQQIKGQFASKRLKFMQTAVANFATGLLRIKAQIICKHYQDETIKHISGAMQLPEQDQVHVDKAIALMRDDSMSDFRIEVSSDSLIEMDEEKEKQDRMLFLKHVGGFMKESAKAPKELGPLLGDLLLFGVRGFKIGKTVEGAIQETVEKLREEAKQPQEKPRDENEIKAEVEQAKIQKDGATEQAKVAADGTATQQKAGLDQELALKKEENSQALALAKVEADKAIAEHKAILDKELGIEKAKIEAETKIKLANLDGVINGEGVALDPATGQSLTELSGAVSDISRAMDARDARELAEKDNCQTKIRICENTRTGNKWKIIESVENGRRIEKA